MTSPAIRRAAAVTQATEPKAPPTTAEPIGASRLAIGVPSNRLTFGAAVLAGIGCPMRSD